MAADLDALLAGLPKEVRSDLTSKNYLRRIAACGELEEPLQAGLEQALEILLAKLGDDHPQVRQAAAQILATGESERVVPPLLEALASLIHEVRPGHRASLVYALSLMEVDCHSPVCEALLALLDHGDQDVRFQALVGLNRIGCTSDRFRQAVVRLLEDPDDEVAAVAASSAAELALVEHRPAIVARWQRAQGFARRHLALAGAHLGAEEVIESLEMAVRSAIDGHEAIEALVALHTPAAQRLLFRLAGSWRVHPLLRARAGVALVEIEHPEAAKLIQRHLAHRKATIRWGTIDWLCRLQRREHLASLLAILQDPSHRDSVEVASSLALLLPSQEVSEALEQAAQRDPRTEVRAAAAEALLPAARTP
ncbi:MAG: HEAT repeat domain-containing protein [Bradymonadales bacterium]|nr:HEAT repeat domain-containing protein [Bradymonadales bacterium]